MNTLQNLIVEIRERFERRSGLKRKASVLIEVRVDAGSLPCLEENQELIKKLARVSEVRFVDQITAGLPLHTTFEFRHRGRLRTQDRHRRERERMRKDIAKQEKIVTNSERQLK